MVPGSLRLKTAIHWFRRDLRLADNSALHAACLKAERVLPVFILEDAFRTGPDVGASRLGFLLGSLESLRRDLAARGSALIVRHGRSEVELAKLCREFNAQAVFCNRRYEPYAQARDNRVFNVLNELGAGFEVFKDSAVWEERELLNKAGKPYTVFTPYAKAWKLRRAPEPKPGCLAQNPFHISVEQGRIPIDPAEFGHALFHSLPPVGERSALDCLQRFMNGPVYAYAQGRDYPAVDGTSHLSAHLRCGTIGVRTVLAGLAEARAKATAEGEKSCDVFLNELIWREFYLQILSNFPHVTKRSFRPSTRAWTGLKTRTIIEPGVKVRRATRSWTRPCDV